MTQARSTLRSLYAVTRKFLPLALLAVLLSACATGGVGGGGGLPADAFLNGLPDFPEPQASRDAATAPAEFDYGTTQVCSTTTYSITSAPEEIVMFSHDPQVFWPGALVQGNSYANGSPLLIPLPNRAPLDLSISGVYAAQSSAFDVTPTQSSVTQAVQGLLNGAVQDEIPTTQNVFFTQEEAYSFEQSALKLGFSANYLGANVEGSLSYETNSEQNTVAANATIRTFTVSVDQPPTPSAFFDGLTQAELDEQIALGRLSETNLPVYVASVTYGQIMMFSATSSSSMSDLQGALSASFSSFAGGGGASVSAEQQQVLQDSNIQVVTLGGSQDGVEDLIRNGTPADFFQDSTVVTSSVPLSFTLKDLKGNVVKVAESTEYDLTTCNPNGFANYYIANADVNAGVQGFYADGTRADLNEEIGGRVSGLAYNSLDDLLYALKSGTSGPFVDIYNPDGSRPAVPVAHGGNNFSVTNGAKDIAYDARNARLYLAGDFNTFGEAVVEAWTLDGFRLNIPFRASLLEPGAMVVPSAIAFDATRERIYVSAQILFNVSTVVGAPNPSYNTVLAFDVRGNQVELEGDFDGLTFDVCCHILGITYDPTLDRIYVGHEIDGFVKAFDAEGNPVELTTPIEGLSQPAGLYFDETYNRLYVLEKGASFVSIFEPDGTPVDDSFVRPFPGVKNPQAIAFRPS